MTTVRWVLGPVLLVWTGTAAAATPPPEPAERGRTEESEPKAAQPESKEEPADPPEGATVPDLIEQREETEVTPLSDWGLGVAGLGLTLTVVGFALNGSAHNKADLIRDAQRRAEGGVVPSSVMTRERALSLRETAQTEEAVSFVMLGIGSAALVAGVVLVVVSAVDAAEEPAEPPVSVMPVERGLVLGTGGRF